MVKDEQVRNLMSLIQKEDTFKIAAAKAGMDEKTARKWRDAGKLPSEVARERKGRTREDPFCNIWEEAKALLKVNRGLEAKTLFAYFQRKYPGRFQDGQLRTFQRRVKVWRATEGPPREVFFPQVHIPGRLCESDFTDMNSLGVTIAGAPFDHILYHLALTCSNWETGTICFSECFEALSEGLQNALWELGGVPDEHRSDRLTAAVHKLDHPEEFTQRYSALLSHYNIKGVKTQPSSPNENGDIESLHGHFKKAVDQALMIRGSRDFQTIEEYKAFLREVFAQRNAGRSKRLREELKVLGRLPAKRLESYTKVKVRVSSGSTIRVQNNTYSVESRLKGEKVNARVYFDRIEVWYAQKLVETLPRLKGEGKHEINYRHIIDTLVRKPGAFANYRYREDLFPTHRFRVAYDTLKRQCPARADKEYLKILHLAAHKSEAGVDIALAFLLDDENPLSAKVISEMIEVKGAPQAPRDVVIREVELDSYDRLLLGVTN